MRAQFGPIPYQAIFILNYRGGLGEAVLEARANFMA